LEGLGISTEDTNSISYWSVLLVFSPAKTPVFYLAQLVTFWR